MSPRLNAQTARFNGSKGSGTDFGRTTVSPAAASGFGEGFGTEGALWAGKFNAMQQASPTKRIGCKIYPLYALAPRARWMAIFENMINFFPGQSATSAALPCGRAYPPPAE